MRSTDRSVGPSGGPSRVLAVGLSGMPEIQQGDNVPALLVHAVERAGETLLPGDVLVVSSKIVSKSHGLLAHSTDRSEVVATQTLRVVAERQGPRGPTRIVRSLCGPVLAAAGVDASNVAAGTVLLLPQDPDAHARRLRAEVEGLTGVRPAVVISDTLGRPWRQGQVDQAIGAAGVTVLDDLRGTTDTHGNDLHVTVRAVADEFAALGDLVKGKIDQVPAALLRGLDRFVTAADGPGAAGLVRGDDGDWFRWGHVEAVRSALGVPPGAGTVAPRPLDPGKAAQRLRRALEVAVEGDRRLAADVEVRTDQLTGTEAVVTCVSRRASDPEALISLGRFGERVRVAGRSEDLQIDLEVSAAPVPRIVLRARL